MKLKSITQSTNFWIILSSVILLIFFYIFYLNYYVAAREYRITATRFRVLDQMGDNIDKKMAGYIKNAKNLNEKISAEWKLGKNSGIRTKFIEGDKKPFIDYVNSQGDINRDLKVVDFITDSQPAIKFRQDIKLLSPYNYYFENPIKDPPFPVLSKDSVAIIVVEAPYHKIVNGLQRKDVFDGLILIRDSTIIYNTLNQDMILTSGKGVSAMIEQANKAPGNNNKPGFLFKSKNNTPIGSIFSGSSFDILIANIPYKAFLKPVVVNKETWYVIGLMDKSNFTKASHSIASWVIILLSLVLVLLILGMPIIKLKVMSKTEQLHTGTIINSAISILLGGSLMALFLFFLTQNLSRQQNIDNNLKKLSNRIYNTWVTEMDNAYHQLELYDNNYNLIDFNDSLNPYHNRIRKDILTENNAAFPTAYPFADYYFWTDNKGKQSAYLTPFNVYGGMTDLSSRDYINKKDEWFFPGPPNRKFRVESIVSFTSGSVKAAISKPGKSTVRPVVALTSRLYSVIDPIVPKNYSFCIMDKNGKVWFHSDKNLNLRENFITECNNNKSLRAAMYRNISRTFNVNYYNDPHRIYIRPMGHLPLYLVVLYNENAEKSFQAQVVTLTLIFTGILFLMVFVQIVVLIVIERHFQWPLTKNLIMKMTRPMMHLDSAYKYLISFYAIVFVVIIPFMVWLNNVQAVVALFALVVFLFNYSFIILNQSASRKHVRYWFTGFNLFLLVLINGFGGFMTRGEGFWKVLLFEGTIMVTILLCHRFLKDKFQKENKNYVKNYNLFLIGLLLLFGIVPTLKFYESAYNTETGIRVKHDQVALMKQREKRNSGIGNYYSMVKLYSPAANILKQRKNLGIYTLFLDSTRFHPANTTGFNREQYKTALGNNYWDTLFCYLRPYYDDYITENKYLIFNGQKNSDMTWRWSGHKLLFQYVSLTEDPVHDKPVIYAIESNVPHTVFYLPFNAHDYKTGQALLLNILFWLIVVGLLFVCYYLLRFGTRRLYCLNIIENYSHQSFLSSVKYHLSAHNNLFVSRLSSIDETNFFSKNISGKIETLYINWINENRVRTTLDLVGRNLDEFMEKTKGLKGNGKRIKAIINKSLIVFIDHFDRNFENPDIFKEKINIVHRLIEKDSVQIILLSQNSPETLAEHYRNLGEAGKKDEKGNNTLLQLQYGFKAMLSNLVTLPCPVNYQRSDKDGDRYCNELPSLVETKEFILSEITATDYLKQLKTPVMNYFNRQCKDYRCKNPEENTIRRIMLLAEKYYKGLLESCSFEEQYVLYDVADDLIVNPNNEKTITSLLEKGLLIKACDRISFMNVSFRRFVLNSLNKSETSKLELKMGKNTGTWRGYRTTLVLIIAGLFVFIALANQDFIENLNQLFVAIGGGVAVVTGLLGLLSKKSKP